MTAPVCVSCEVEYRPADVGVGVIEMFLDPPEPYKISYADVWRCPICGHKIATGFSSGKTMHHESSFETTLASVMSRPHVLVYEQPAPGLQLKK